MREEAVGRGLSISEWGIEVAATGETVRLRDEDEVYRFLGYAPVLKVGLNDFATGTRRV